VFRSNLRFAWNEGGIDTRIGAKGMPAKAAPHTGVFDNVEGGAQSTQPAEGAKSSGG
jgi:hypothetical protein